MSKRPTLIFDVMGADLGIEEMVKGAGQACAAAADQPFHLVLVSSDPALTKRAADEQLAESARRTGCSYELAAAAQTLPAHIDSPVEAFRAHPQCSIRVAMDIAKATENSAVISPGTTGLVMTSALYTLGRVKGIERPPIGTFLPTKDKMLFFVDGGANVECRASQLYQFALLAHLFVQIILKIDQPSIVLLSNGSEDYKGNAVVREAYALLEADKDLNFKGYIEGHTMIQGGFDIMVCDGFLGNILLKFAEGVAGVFTEILKQELKKDILAALSAKYLQRQAYRRVAERLDYARYGGAPLLGLNSNVVICHGRSSAKAIKNALLGGYKLAESNIAQQVAQYIEAHPPLPPANGGKK